MGYFIGCKSKGLVLTKGLSWHKYREIIDAPEKVGELLCSNMEDALLASRWMSGSKLSFNVFPAKNMEKEMRRYLKISALPFSLQGIDRDDIKDGISAGVLPNCLRRAPASHIEKQQLLGKLLAVGTPLCGSHSSWPSKGVPQKVGLGICYICDMRKAKLLKKDLSWARVDDIRTGRVVAEELLVIKGNLSLAQNLCQWYITGKNQISPCSVASIAKKFELVLPSDVSDTFASEIKSARYPKILLRRPFNKEERASFQSSYMKTDDSVSPALSMAVVACIEEMSNIADLPISSHEDLVYGEMAVDLPVEVCEGELSPDEHGCPEAEAADGCLVHDSALICEVMEFLCKAQDLMSRLSELISDRRETLEQSQMKELDLAHLAEFFKLNATDGYRVYHKLHGVRVNRRVAKNELAVLKVLTDVIENINMKKVNTALSFIEGMDSRKYSARALTEEELSALIRNPKTRAQISDTFCM